MSAMERSQDQSVSSQPVNDHHDPHPFESSLVSNPCKTFCNIFWGNRLAARPFMEGDPVISFSSLWPDDRNFVDLYREGGMEQVSYHIVKLLLASDSTRQLEVLLKAGLLTWEYGFQDRKVTLIHLICALNSKDMLELALKLAPANGLWSIKDGNNRIPADVCLNSDLRKLLKKQKAFWSSLPKVQTGLQLTSDAKKAIFQCASKSDMLYEMCILLQTYRFNVNEEKDETGSLLLHNAVKEGLPCLPHVFVLVRLFGADVNLPNQQGHSPLCLASKLGEERVAEVLVCVFGAAINVHDERTGWTPLHYSASENHPELIRMLLSRGADACSETKNQCVPSHLAQQEGATECTQILAMHSQERATSLAMQALQGVLDVNKLFPSDISLVTNDGFTLLMKAVLGDQPDLVRALVNTRNCPLDFRQMTLPDLSDIEGSLSCLPSVVEQPLKTALHLAAANGFTECLKLLLEAGAKPAIEDSQQWLPLHYASDGGHLECVKAIVSQPKGDGLTRIKLAMSLAKERGQENIVFALRQALQRRQQQIVKPRLFELAISGDRDGLFLLLEDGDDVNMTNETSDWPLLLAAGYGHLDIVKTLSEHGDRVVRFNSYTRNNPLHTAARGGHVDVLKYLLQNYCAPAGVSVVNTTAASRLLDINEKNNAGVTALEMAAMQGHMPAVRLLLEHGAVTTLPDSNGQLLGSAAFCGIQFLLENCRREQLTRIHRAIVEQKPLKEFKQLWQGPSDFNLRDNHWETVLMVAARLSRPEVIEFLLQSATQYSKDMKINWSTVKFKPISRQIRSQSLSLETSAPQSNPYGGPLVENIEGSSSGEGAGAGATAAVGPCTQSGIVCLVNRDGRTALHHAVEGNMHHNIPLLLRADHNVANIQDKHGQTALHLACHLSRSKCIKALLRCEGVFVDAGAKDKANHLAEDLCVKKSQKKKVMQHRSEQQPKNGHPTTWPLPSTPPPLPRMFPGPGDMTDEDDSAYSNIYYHHHTTSLGGRDGNPYQRMDYTQSDDVSSTQRRRRRARHRNTSPVPLSSDDQGPCPRRLSTIEDHPTTSPNSMTLTMQQRVADMRDQVHHADTSTTDHDSY